MKSLREDIHNEMVKYNFLWSSIMTDKVMEIIKKHGYTKPPFKIKQPKNW